MLIEPLFQFLIRFALKLAMRPIMALESPENLKTLYDLESSFAIQCENTIGTGLFSVSISHIVSVNLLFVNKLIFQVVGCWIYMME